MKKSYRVKRDRDFQLVFKEGQSYANRQFVVYSLNRQLAHLRLGLSVSKKLGNAVRRNRVKRQLRHLIMEFEPDLKTYDMVIIARKGVEDLTYVQMKQHLSHVLTKAKLYKETIA
ncbi:MULTISPECIES: ribonuclease P protein component [unclassified Streptococcus]|uniref:ribonuclease P protein component n=1 Tax=unclassified Streptococcus TaxID=2608887 RepID=UPI00359D8CE2